MNSVVSVSKERDSNLELYRIVVMLLIVAHHYVVCSGLVPVLEQEPLSLRSVSMYLAGMWGKTGINCFVLITGYFMCTSHITVRKFLKLFLEVEFYRILFYMVFLLSGYQPFTLRGLIKVLLPFWSVASNFIGCYLLFFLLIPSLNVLIKHINRRQHLMLCVLCLTIYTVLGSLPTFYVVMNYVSWFCVLYLIASYLRLYGCFGIKPQTWKWLAIVSVLLSVGSVLFILWANAHFALQVDPYFFVADSNKIFALITAIASFMTFKHLTIKSNKFINKVSACTFGVFLIHGNSNIMNQWLWCDTFDNVGKFTNFTPPQSALDKKRYAGLGGLNIDR